MKSQRDIARYRLANQQISHARSSAPVEVVASLGAMQAQDYPGALWAIGMRLPHSTEADVEQAIADRSIIRTWPMRGTLHFVTATDSRWMLDLLTPRIIAGSAHRYQELGLDDTIFARSRDLAINALHGTRQLTRGGMLAQFEAGGISTAGQRGSHILGRLAQEGLLCFGTREGKQQTFALLAEWAPEARSLERDEALAELAKRYFTGHGPATLQDLVRWAGLKISDARAGLNMVSSHLANETIDGTDYWMPQHMPDLLPALPTTYLLPGFDEFMLGYKDRSASLDPFYAQQIGPGNNGMFSPTIVANGRVVGTWQRTIKRNMVVIKTSPFAALSNSEKRSLVAAAENYGRFLEMPVSLERC